MLRKVSVFLACFGLLSAVAPASQDGDLPRLREIAKVLEKTAADFSDHFDHELDKSFLDDTPLKGKLDERAEKLRRALDDVRDKLKGGNLAGAGKKLDRALQLANDIHLVMKERRFSHRLENEWAEIVDNLNVLADYYGMRPLL
ncbi:MAG: hypothetical protein GC160_01820 [Acidobacteria bacterium]|nr:hypothetical protein [Acidobacteriota bacterium]